MIKALGIVITEEMIKERLLAEGKDKLQGLAYKQAAAEATLALATEQSKNALGDFGRTQDSFANQSRILQARLEDLRVELGEKLLPVATQIVSAVVGVVEKINEWTRDQPGLTDTVVKFVAVLGTLFLGLGPVVMGIGKMTQAAATMKVSLLALTGGVLILVAALAALVVGYLKVKEAQDKANAAARNAAEAEDNLFRKLKAAADQAGLSEKEFLKLRDAYNGNAAAMAWAIKHGKEGKELQEALTDVSAKHKEKIDEQKGALDNLGSGFTGVTEKAKTWHDFLKDQSIQTVKEKSDKVIWLEGVLRDLEKAYKDGKITLEDYTKATEAAKDEIFETGEMVAQTPPKANDLAAAINGNLTPAIKTTTFAFMTAEERIDAFAATTSQSAFEVKQKMYDLTKTMMGFAGVTMPEVVISNKAAWPQIRDEADKTCGAFTQVSQRIKDQWTTGLAEMLQGTRSFGDVMGSIWGTVKTQFFTLCAQMLSKWTLGFIGGILGQGGGIADSILGPFKNIAKGLTGSQSGTGGGGIFGDTAGSFIGSITKMAGPIGIGLLVGKMIGFENIANTFKGIWNGISDVVITIIGNIGEQLEAIGDIAVTVFEGVGKVIGSALGAASDIISGIGSAIGGLLSGIGGLFKKKKTPDSEKLQNIQELLSQIVGHITIDFRDRQFNWMLEKMQITINHIEAIRTLFANRFDQKLSHFFTRIETIKERVTRTFQDGHNRNAILHKYLGEISDHTKRTYRAIQDLSTAQTGAMFREPALVMAHGTPTSPEYILREEQVAALAGMATPAITITNQVNLKGMMISDRDYARTRMIPEILAALEVNFNKSRLKEILGV